MCCITLQTSSEKAEEDIYVYKVFGCKKLNFGDKTLCSPFYEHSNYHCGDEDISCGVFSYDVSSNIVFKYNGFATKYYMVEFGFHSFKNIEDAELLQGYLNKHESSIVQNYHIYKCRIKKGTSMFSGIGTLTSCGQYDCYVSEKIDILERI